MISILAQERLLGATLGSAVTGFIVLEQRNLINESLSHPKSQSQVRRDGMLLDKKYRMEFASLSLWNRAVDQTFQPAIQYLSSRNW